MTELPCFGRSDVTTGAWYGTIVAARLERVRRVALLE
jgi:hypothetical protein